MPNIIEAKVDWEKACEIAKIIAGLSVNQCSPNLFYLPEDDVNAHSLAPWLAKHELKGADEEIWMGHPEKKFMGYAWISNDDLLVLGRKGRKWSLRFEGTDVASNLVVHFALAAEEGTLGFVIVEDMMPIRKAFNENRKLWQGRGPDVEAFLDKLQGFYSFLRSASVV